MSDTDDSGQVSVEWQLLGEDGHMSMSLYAREDTEFRAVYDPDLGLVTLYVNGYGGSMSVSLTAEQWSAVGNALSEVIPQVVEA